MKRERRLRSLARSVVGCEKRIAKFSREFERLDCGQEGMLFRWGIFVRGGKNAVRLRDERRLEQARSALHMLRDGARGLHSETAVEKLGDGDGRKPSRAQWKTDEPDATEALLPTLRNLSPAERKAMLSGAGDVSLL